MALYLIQHGKCLSREADPAKGLSEEGKNETRRMATLARDYHVKVHRIIHSGKKRARQTADIFGQYLRPDEGVGEEAGLKPLDDVDFWASKLSSAAELMLVGHLPFMERLSGALTTGRADLAPFRFQNSGIVCLSQDAPGDNWFIKWALMPNIK